MVECMVRKSKKILSIPTKKDNMTPILLASLNERWDVVDYLYSVTPLQDLMPEKGPYGAGLLFYYILGMKFGIALELIQRCPQLVFTKTNIGAFPLEGFMPSAFQSGIRLKLWQRWIYNCIHIERAISDIRVSVQNEGNEESNPTKITWSVVGFLQGLKSNLLELLGINRIREIKQAHIQSLELLHHMCEVIKHTHGYDHVFPATFRAIERGMVEFTDSVLQARPDLMWISTKIQGNLIHFAIECRQEKIYSLIYRLDKRKRTLIGLSADMSNNFALHMAGMLSPRAKLDNISGAALQMQRELQWFKEVETIGLPRVKECTNREGMTPHELFTKNHKEMVKEGERWMKETATSCTVVGALIITIMFAAAFTIPGGNNGETGFPIFLYKKLFMAFIVADAMSLFSSTTSVLMFLGILTSRYAEEDFLKSLPTKMIIGLSTLFISIATMMVAFSSALFIMIHEQSWIVIPTIFLASVPVTLFIWMQFPLLVEMYVSTYGRGIFNRKVKSRA
ncbi:PREDICTED: ankyrin repeat-containing protein At3g12360-like [Prunus mume]|uniref:Ankyrin repeat-containing protein At3g12360-like n=1 Tax=Prunus mume TaxID=102107 RepID=A0ABM1LYL4_PRUMU|nr:PREDICTED: ankyrin repeat-containing protein At3g12360-like [Prunus mume]